MLSAAVAVAPQSICALEIDPAAEEAFFAGVALLEAGDPSGAVAMFDQALRIDKQLRRVHFYRARAWGRLGDIDEARADLAAYEAFPLTDSEKKQLAELKGEINERAEQIGTARVPDRTTDSSGQEGTTGPDGFSLLRAAEEELARGACDKAAQGAQEALQADNTLTRAFLIKGLALECLDENERALTVIGMYEELRAGQSPDPVATAARERLEGSGGGEPPSRGPTWSVLGGDSRIEGVFGQQWGLPMAQAVEVRTRRSLIPGVGPADVGRPRMSIGGSTARVERAWFGDQDEGLTWTRLRVFERSGLETVAWFARSFGELYREVERTAGKPDIQYGLEGPPESPEGAKAALRGTRRIEVRWKDEDGDVISLRLGRCTLTGDISKVHPNNAPCLELVSWSGAFEGSKEADKATKAAQRIESPGRLQVDLSGGLGVGMAPTLWGLNFRTNTETALGGELGLDVNFRAAFGPLVTGVGYMLSVAGYSTFTRSAGPFADNRLMFYLGLRDRPRQRQMTDIMLGVGLVPEAGGAAPAISLRFLSQVRTAPIGRFFVSFEPYAVVGRDLTLVPVRFAIGGLFGTKQRSVRPRGR